MCRLVLGLVGIVAVLWTWSCGSDQKDDAPTKNGGSNASNQDGSAGTSSTGGQGTGEAEKDGDTGEKAVDASMRCASNQDCPPGQSCDSETGRCVPRTRCQSNSDCASLVKTNICDTVAGECVECSLGADCPAKNECIRRVCVPVTSCVNTRDCPGGLVCNATRGRCVECVTDAECGDDRRCGNDVCRAACASDLTCRPFGLLCDAAKGYCIECIGHADCAADWHCAEGTCKLDVCKQGSSRCENNAIVSCDAVGSKLEPAQACSPQFCAESGGTATCRTRVCTPSAVFCDGSSKLIECSVDGFTQTVKQDCASTSQACVARACQTVIFADNFEDGDLNGWTAGSGAYVRMVSADQAADGTTRSLYLFKQGGSGYLQDGIYKTFAAVQPTRISFWFRPSYNAPWRTEFSSSDTGYAPLVTFQSTGGELYLTAATSLTVQAINDAWHQVELRNINWSARSFDYWVDGTERSVGIVFATTGTSIARVDLYAVSTGMPAYWDEFVLQ